MLAWGKIAAWALKNWKLVAIGGLALALVANYSITSYQIGKLRKAKDVAEANYTAALQTNADNLAVFKKAEDQWKSAEKVANEALQESAKQTAKYRNLLEQIQSAPEKDDGPVSPVLRGAIERLYPDSH